MRIGIFIHTIVQNVYGGPDIALLKLCEALTTIDHSHELVFIYNAPSSTRELFVQYERLLVPKLPYFVGKVIQSANIDSLFLNGIPSRLRSWIYHQYPSIHTTAYVHGTLAWLPDYAYGGALTRSGWREKFQDNRSKQIQRWAKRSFSSFATNSNFTLNFMVRELKVNPLKCQVISLGVDHNVFYPRKTRSDLLEKYNVRSKYMMTVNNYKARQNPKNVETTAKVFRRLRERGHDIQWVIVGKGWSIEHFSVTEDNDFAEDIVITGELPPNQIAELYSSAEFYIQPSLQETFGLSLLEAMASGCPVISSNWSAIPEVVGDAALLADNPLDPEEIVSLAETLLSNDMKRKTLEEKSILRAKNYQWEHSAKNLIQFLEEQQHM